MPASSDRSAAWAPLVLLGATVVAGRPWTFTPGYAFPQRDAAFDLVARVHLEDALLGRAGWREGWLGFPLADRVALTDWALGPALLDLPLRALGVAAVPATLVLVAAGLFLTAWACQRLAAAVTGPGPHTWVAGVAGGLSAAHLAHAHHVNLVHHELLAAGLLAAGVGLTRARPALAAVGGLLLGGSGHFGAYVGLHSVLIAGVGAVGVVVGRVGRPRERLAAVAGLVLGLATFAPVAAVYSAFAARHGYFMSPDEVLAESWDLAYALRPLPTAPLHALLGAPAPARVDPDNPGYLALLLLVLGCVAGFRATAGTRLRLAWALSAVAVAVASLLALGPTLRFDGAPVVATPLAWLPLGSLGARGPARWLAVAAVAASPLVAFGARALLSRVPARARPAAALLPIVILLGELPRTAAAPVDHDVAADPVYAAVAAVPGEGALAERVTERCHHDAVDKLRAVLVHGRPVVGGQYARAFPAARAINEVTGGWPGPEARTFFREVGVHVVLEHPPLRPLPADLADACTLVDDHRLCTLPVVPARFPAAARTDGPGPWIGVRWATPPRARTVTLSCEGRTEEHSPFPWAALTLARDGSEGGVDILLDAPCAAPPTASLPGGTPIASVERGS